MQSSALSGTVVNSRAPRGSFRNTGPVESAYPRRVAEPSSKYQWLDVERDDDALMAACIGVVKGLDAAEVGNVLRVDAASERDATLAEAWAMSDSEFGHEVVQVTTISDAVVTVEPNGWHGTEPEIAAALSQGGRYAAYFWNVNSVMRFVFSERGLVVRSFDPVLYDSGGSSEPALPEEAGLPFPSGDDAPLTPSQASLDE